MVVLLLALLVVFLVGTYLVTAASFNAWPFTA
jgi:hypothetical protein